MLVVLEDGTEELLDPGVYEEEALETTELAALSLKSIAGISSPPYDKAVGKA